MKCSLIFQLALASSALAAPALTAPTEAEIALLKARASGLNDADILNFALTLEHLEAIFYREAVMKFDESDFSAAGYDSSVRKNIVEIASDEANHVKFLEAALKAYPAPAVPACKYDFGYTDVKSFMQTAAVLEGVGVSAYLGAAHLISSPTYLTAAGSILTIEARHSAYIRNYNMPQQSPFAYPFETAQDPMAVYSLASQFITSCPSAANLGFTPFPLLTLKSGQNSPVNQGKTIVLELAKGATATKGKTYAFFADNLGWIAATTKVMSPTEVEVTIPSGTAGQSYVSLANTNNATMVSDSNIVAGPAIVMIQAPYTKGGLQN